ncbi:alpha/beta hydrolase [Lactobacillus sp. R2/2]|nr:alpha/beta hydrolase [Lactobacillus sp. R2/2]
MSADYRELLSLRKQFPQNADVLNIYGDTGSGSDGDVTVNSARSYRYLVSKRAHSYQEQEIKGPRAQHSKLHENTNVDRLLVNFLW